jgi:TM2 domain-containing membrane protein YozV
MPQPATYGVVGSPHSGPLAHYPPGGMAQQYQVAPKNPAISLLVSFFIPGVGSMMNGDVGKGVGILVGYLISCVLILVLIGIVGVIGFWIWGLIDAYSGAKRWNMRHGIIS